MNNEQQPDTWKGVSRAYIPSPLLWENAVNKSWESLRQTYLALEEQPDNDFYRIAFLKARLAWRRLSRRHP